MRYYRNFYTDLPDQFVEAFHEELGSWAREAVTTSPQPLDVLRTLSGVELRLNLRSDRRTVQISLFRAPGSYEISRWLSLNGDKYDGLYWESLTEAERRPPRAPSGSGGGTSPLSGTVSVIDPNSGYYYGAGAFPGRGTHPSLNAVAAALQQQQVAQVNQALLAQYQADIGNIYNQFLGMTVYHPYQNYAGGLGMAQYTRPDLKREIVAGEIVAYRCWCWRGGYITSVAMPDVWKPGETLVGRGLEDWGKRGVHAWKELSREYFDYIRGAAVTIVGGTVYLWGDVVEHELGYRAEYARIRSLDWVRADVTTFGREQALLEQLRATYGV